MPQKFSRLPPLGAIFLSAPPNLKSWIRPWLGTESIFNNIHGKTGLKQLIETKANLPLAYITVSDLIIFFMSFGFLAPKDF